MVVITFILNVLFIFFGQTWFQLCSTICPGTKKPKLAAKSNTVAHTLTETPVKDNPSITSTLKILCTVDTRSSDPTNTDTDTILSITIWNQLIVKCQMPIRSTTRNQSWQLSAAVRYALIAVYDKLLNPPKLPCLWSLFTSITCILLSCFILLADSFALVKIDDRYPDEWFD